MFSDFGTYHEHIDLKGKFFVSLVLSYRINYWQGLSCQNDNNPACVQLLFQPHGLVAYLFFVSVNVESVMQLHIF